MPAIPMLTNVRIPLLKPLFTGSLQPSCIQVAAAIATEVINSQKIT